MAYTLLPTELWLEVLEDLAPATPWTPADYALSECSLLPIFKLYHRRLQHLASIRSVCQQWDAILCDLIYNHVVLPSHPLSIARETIGILRHHVDRIRAITICDLSYGDRPITEEERGVSAALVNRHLQKYLGNAHTRIHIERLVLEGGEVYMKRNWGPKTIPNAPATVKHLVLSFLQAIPVSLALVHLGQSLETLELHEWSYYDSDTPPTFHLPKQFQCLQKLVLQNCCIAKCDAFKLFERIGALTYCPKHKKRIHQSQLRDFRVKGGTSLDPNRIVTMLRTNSIGKGLTILHIHFHHGRMYLAPETAATISHSAAATAIAKECQSLIDFRYAGSIEKAFFKHLSKSLKILALAVWPPSIRPHESILWWQSLDLGYFTPDKIGDVVSLSENRYHLERLIILVQCLVGEDTPPDSFIKAVYEALEALGIPFEVELLNAASRPTT
ncbi:hypothetical protein CC1G_02319 [Coprinopsis cinerea okayama7|uniref:F-box domain-containing protein n=1 Tax=Coprinopsis cinerea (strain Okayama-7 / 130 / ATCC MYA-4618 / FGSC 9003) TaxID=240176 RepID=A8N7R2_COPC7|nr:hypothetical protein CC1G_02319 [Coprinopsis cinerea okayama7\|eukprot:XP_001830868.1 hypothetical protein CC1G_02319 [Coprinopsis cinerea okayama7\